eukprot:8522884-Alexandrium_andersonii.AAC.1
MSNSIVAAVMVQHMAGAVSLPSDHGGAPQGARCVAKGARRLALRRPPRSCLPPKLPPLRRWLAQRPLRRPHRWRAGQTCERLQDQPPRRLFQDRAGR